MLNIIPLVRSPWIIWNLVGLCIYWLRIYNLIWEEKREKRHTGKHRMKTWSSGSLFSHKTLHSNIMIIWQYNKKNSLHVHKNNTKPISLYAHSMKTTNNRDFKWIVKPTLTSCLSHPIENLRLKCTLPFSFFRYVLPKFYYLNPQR